MSSLGFTGKVVRIGERPFTSKKTGKPGTAFSIVLVDDQGNEFDPVGGMFDRPACNVGDTVSLSATERDGYFNLIKGTLNVTARGAPAQQAVAQPKQAVAKAAAPAQAAAAAPAAQAQATPVQEQTGRRTNPEDAKRMTYADSRKAAIALVDLLLRNKALPVSAAPTKAAEADRNATIHAAVQKYTVEFFNDSLTLRVLDVVADTPPDTSGDGALPDSASEESNLDA